ncbi:MAG: hypothetical protein K2X32_02630 [Phycisphaerales bacterium]|nr:hypothetical protein [Phycisphaerales bacterium]
MTTPMQKSEGAADERAGTGRGTGTRWRLPLAEMNGLWFGLLIVPLLLFYRTLITLSEQHASWNITRAKFDQDLFHLRVIRQFATELPSPDLSNYLSATTPGYHLVLSMFVRVMDPIESTLRLFGAVFSVWLVLVLLGAALGRHSRVADGDSRGSIFLRGLVSGALVLPLLASSYVLQSAIYLLPDNAAWLLVLITMLLALGLTRAAVGVRALVPCAIVVVLLVLTRQIHIWAAAPIWVGALVSAAGSRRGSSAALRGRGSDDPATVADEIAIGDLLRAIPSRAVIMSIVATLPAFAVLGYFVWLWGGIAPPLFRAATNPAAASGAADATAVTGISPATPVLILALIGIFGTFYSVWFVRASIERATGLLRKIDGLIETLKVAAISAGVAGVIALVPPTVWSSPTRKGALWEITRKFEGGRSIGGVRLPRLVLGDHTNLVMWALAVLGGAVLGVLWRAVDGRSRWVLATGLIGFTAAQSAQALSWQRYVEPFVLMWLVLCVCCLRGSGSGASGAAAASESGAWRRAVVDATGPVVLAVMLAAIAWSAFGG